MAPEAAVIVLEKTYVVVAVDSYWGRSWRTGCMAPGVAGAAAS